MKSTICLSHDHLLAGLGQAALQVAPLSVMAKIMSQISPLFAHSVVTTQIHARVFIPNPIWYHFIIPCTINCCQELIKLKRTNPGVLGTIFDSFLSAEIEMFTISMTDLEIRVCFVPITNFLFIHIYTSMIRFYHSSDED